MGTRQTSLVDCDVYVFAFGLHESTQERMPCVINGTLDRRMMATLLGGMVAD